MATTATTLCGIGIGDGAVLGRLHWLTQTAVPAEPRPVRSPAEERERFTAAQRRTREALNLLCAESRIDVGEEAAQIFATHAMIAEDEDFSDLVLDRITDGEGAEAAVIAAAETLAAQFRSMEDDYLRARADDFADIAARLCDSLAEEQRETAYDLPDWDEPIILAAHDLTPSRTVGLDRTRVGGFVTAAGSPGSHTAILARSLSLPALVAVGDIDIREGQRVLLDAAAGRLTVDPDPTVLAAYHTRAEARAVEELARMALIERPAETRSGRRVMLCANIGHPDEAEAAVRLGADGVGLFRSEFLYLDRTAPPDEDEQYAAYRAAADALGGRMLIIRTLDLGADKQVDYLGMAHEENPALGVRGIRLCLDRRALFRTQLRAICRAAGRCPGQLGVMFPMLTSTAELDAALRELHTVEAELRAQGTALDDALAVGIMIETPAAAIMADAFASRCAFFSIGSNDLTQYTLAVDRQNAAVAPLADGLHPAVLALIERAATAIHATGGWCGVCGELAADPTLTEALLAAGIDELSVAPSALLAVKESVCGLA